MKKAVPPSRAYAQVHKVAAAYERRLYRELMSAVSRMRQNVNLMNPSVGAAVFNHPKTRILQDAMQKMFTRELQHVGDAVVDAVLHGGELGAAKLRGVKRGR